MKQAGEELATAGNSKCSPNFIHLSIKKNDVNEYVDPSSFLHKQKPGVTWTTDCNERGYTYMFETTEMGKVTDQLKKAWQEIKRSAVESIDNLIENLQKPPNMTVPIFNSAGLSGFVDEIMQELQDITNHTKLYLEQ